MKKVFCSESAEDLFFFAGGSSGGEIKITGRSAKFFEDTRKKVYFSAHRKYSIEIIC